jgi:hypothetical protein
MKVEAMAAVKMVEQYDMGEAIEVLQSRMVLIKYLNFAAYTGRTLWLNRHSLRL